jgi:transglutaminase-like putative cysteine protease
LVTEPQLDVRTYIDSFGNKCARFVAPPGRLRLSMATTIRDSGEKDPVHLAAPENAVGELPNEVLTYLLSSRYCEVDRLSNIAVELFGNVAPGWNRVQAICDYVHNHIVFAYADARRTRTAWEAFNERKGVCRDFAHLAIALCRCMNIPARYCTGYLGDMGTPPPYSTMDFAAWFEAYLGGAWHTFDPRNNVPRIGRILIARGRDAADVAIATTFGPHWLERFTVCTDEIR